MTKLVLIALVVATAHGSACAGSPDLASLCVLNQTTEQLFFTVRGIDPEAQVGRTLARGETLCLHHAGRGVVAAFETPESLEGCSRLVPAGGQETLVDFGRFDRCAWASQDD